MSGKVFVSFPILSAALDKLREVADVKQWRSEENPTHEQLVEAVSDVDALYCQLADRIDAKIIEAAKHLRVISVQAVGFDNIDVACATRKGIPIGYTPDVLSGTTADVAFALLMATARKIVQSDRYVRSGQWKNPWQPSLMLGQDVNNSILGIIGMGRIGREMARRARGFNMRILYTSRHREDQVEKELGARYVSLQELLGEADFVSVHVPLNESTCRLIGAKELALMKPTSFLINTSRGQIVDQQALYEALKAGIIGGAGLDVMEKEPISPDDKLLTLDNVVLTPHIGSATVATRTRMALLAAENLIAGLAGKPLLHCVNPEVYRIKEN